MIVVWGECYCKSCCDHRHFWVCIYRCLCWYCCGLCITAWIAVLEGIIKVIDFCLYIVSSPALSDCIPLGWIKFKGLVDMLYKGFWEDARVYCLSVSCVTIAKIILSCGGTSPAKTLRAGLPFRFPSLLLLIGKVLVWLLGLSHFMR